MSFEYHLINEVVANDCYRISNLNLQKEIPTIVDVGANIGIFSYYAHTKYPKAKIYSFELMEDNYQKAKKRLLDIENIKLYNKGVIGDSNPCGVFTNENNPGGHKVIFEDSKDYCNKNRFLNKHIPLEVEYIKFSEIFESLAGTSIDLLKLDCEGGEYDILFQCEKLNYFDRIKNIVMEIHGRTSQEYEYLKQYLNKKYKFFLAEGHYFFCSNQSSFFIK
jgi:FkbM family methyltransferase